MGVAWVPMPFSIQRQSGQPDVNKHSFRGRVYETDYELYYTLRSVMLLYKLPRGKRMYDRVYVLT